MAKDTQYHGQVSQSNDSAGNGTSGAAPLCFWFKNSSGIASFGVPLVGGVAHLRRLCHNLLVTLKGIVTIWTKKGFFCPPWVCISDPASFLTYRF
jgi:hypothetical protein